MRNNKSTKSEQTEGFADGCTDFIEGRNLKTITFSIIGLTTNPDQRSIIKPA